MSQPTTYIAFLRGINVGNIRIKMTDLKLAFEAMGFEAVKTYLQTGNVVFSSTKTIEEIKPILESGLTQTFHYEAFVLLYPYSDLAEIIEQYPMERAETHHAYVIFVENEAVLDNLKQIAADINNDSETIVAGKKVLYWRVERGKSTDTDFAKLTSKAKYKSVVTVRNINTLEKM